MSDQTERRDTDPDICPKLGKVRHRHYSAARRAMRQQTGHLRHKNKRTEGLQIFRCRHCGGFHIGRTELDRMKASKRTKGR